MDTGEYYYSDILEQIALLEERQRSLEARILAIRNRQLLIQRQPLMPSPRATAEVERDHPNHSDDEIDSQADTESASTDSTYVESLSDSDSTDEESDCTIEMDCYCENCPEKVKLGK